MSWFNTIWLESALKGKPVLLRDGSKAFIRYHETELDIDRPLIGVVLNTHNNKYYPYSWSTEGKDTIMESPMDIIGLYDSSLEFEYWHILNDEIVAIAKDNKGVWSAYTKPPVFVRNTWMLEYDLNVRSFTLPDYIFGEIFPECDWKASLILRPTTE